MSPSNKSAASTAAKKKSPGQKLFTDTHGGSKIASPITPGEILLEEYLQSMGIPRNAMGRAIGVPPRAITPSLSIRFGEFFG